MRTLGLLALVACGGGSRVYPSAPASTTSQLAAGCDAGMVSVDGLTYSFGRDAVAVIRGRTVLARTATPMQAATASPWTAAAAILAPSGGRWAVGLAGDQLWRVTSTGELEAINRRLGLGDRRVLAFDAAGDTLALGLEDGVVIARDALHVMQFPGERAPLIAASKDRIAIGRPTGVEVFDLATRTRQTYAVRDVQSLAFLAPTTATAKLVVRARDAAYVEEGGALRRVSIPADARKLVVAGSRIWLLANRGLFAIEGASAQRAAIELGDRDQLCGADNGDAWLGRADTASLISFDRGAVASVAAAPARTPWQTIVEPVFEAVCARCHQPGGEADLDLTTAVAWRENADLIEEVLSTGVMPPPGTTLRSEDRAALLKFVRR